MSIHFKHIVQTPVSRLTVVQRVHLVHMLKLQSDGVFNNGRRNQIETIIKQGEYTSIDADGINEMNTVYIKFKKTGIAPIIYTYQNVQYP